MFNTLKQTITHQYEAALSTLSLCVECCPDDLWDEPVARYPFSQVVFHTLFFADFHLGTPAESFKEQSFHLDNTDFFADYEQLEDREPVSIYKKVPILKYVAYCREKMTRVLEGESVESFTVPCGFARRNFSRAELHIYNIRHIQHHAAQLILRLRLDSDVDIRWVGSGWSIE